MKKRSFRRMLIFALAVFALMYLGLVAILAMVQGRLLFFPTSEIDRTPSDFGWEYDGVSLEVGQEKTSGWYVHTEDRPKGVILFSHGNAGNISGRLESVGLFRDMGYDVFLYDYGGYGESTGKPSEKRCYEDIRAAWRYLTDERKIAPEEIVLHGRSLGAGPTCQLATEVVPAAVILESAFTSVPDIAQEFYPIVPVRFLLTLRFDNGAKVGRFQSPVMVVHSVDDDLIPFHHGEKLFDLAREPKAFLEINGDHNSGIWISRERYTSGLAQFLDEHLNSEAVQGADSTL